MGYTTTFDGVFMVKPMLTEEHVKYLHSFSNTRRMKRNAAHTAILSDPIRLMVGLPIGEEGEYYVGNGNDYGQNRTVDIIDYNNPPASQPGLWCKWVPTEDYRGIEWNGVEKFYDYVEWLEYLIKHFLTPWGYKVNGKVTWQGEETGDVGVIAVKNNKVFSNSIDLKTLTINSYTSEETTSETTRLIYCEGTSNKFWEITQKPDGNYIHYGKIGTKGQFAFKPYTDAAQATKEKEKAIKEKLNKGYVEDSIEINPAIEEWLEQVENGLENMMTDLRPESISNEEYDHIISFLSNYVDKFKELKGD